MRCDLEDMTDRERFVLTKAQLFEILLDCSYGDAEICVNGERIGDFVPEFSVPVYIEVQEVLGE